MRDSTGSTTLRANAVVQPFPFAALRSFTRAEAAAIARMKRAARVVRLDAIGQAIASMTGLEARVSVSRLQRSEPRGPDDAIGVMLSLPGEKGLSRRILIELEGTLASRLVARAIEQKGPAVVDPARAPSPVTAGATAAVVVAILRRAHAGAPLQAIAAGPAHALARDLGAATTAWITLALGEEGFDVRVSVPDAAEAPNERSSSEILEHLGTTPIAMPVVFATCSVTREELATLAVGDAFVPGALSLVGRVVLVAPRSERGISGNLAADGRLVIGETEEHPWVMPESPESRTDVLIDAPVVVRVELGTVEMPAKAWAELGAGDVISLGRRIGDPAILRIGGVEVARGELVQIDGEYGVRILERAKGGA